MPPKHINRSSSRFTIGTSLLTLGKPKSNSTSRLGSPPLGDIRHRSALFQIDELDFVRSYEQHKLAFELNFHSHSKSVQEFQEELNRLAASVEALSVKNEELIERIFCNFLEFEDCVHQNSTLKMPNQMKLKELFKLFDKDGNGTINEEELKIGFRKIGKDFSDEQLAEIMRQADANHTGFIDYGEFISLMISKVLLVK